jgi:hypothetical protein
MASLDAWESLSARSSFENAFGNLGKTGRRGPGSEILSNISPASYCLEGGQYLESFAERRASREMTALLARVPRSAVRYRNGRLEVESVDEDAVVVAVVANEIE